MRHSVQTGFSFGLTSGIITTLGLIVGLYSSTNDRLVVIGGIITIAIADALSDSLGIHISEESECVHTVKEIWESTLATFFSKFVFSSSFLLPVVFCDLLVAIYISVIWGFSLIAVFSYLCATQQNKSPWEAIVEHLSIGTVVIVVTFLVGRWVSHTFG